MSQTSLHRPHSHASQTHGNEALPDYAAIPELHYLDLLSLAEVDVTIAARQVGIKDQRRAKVNRDELKSFLQVIIHVRRKDAGQPLDVLVQWARDVLQALETPDHSGWNFYHIPNYASIVKYFHALGEPKARNLLKVFSKKDEQLKFVEIVQANGPVKKYTVDQILDTLKLDSVFPGRKQALNSTFANISTVLDLGDQVFNFGILWQSNIQAAIEQNTHNFEDDDIWYRIAAVLEYIGNSIEKRDHASWKHLSHRKRVLAIEKKYPWKEVVAKMDLALALPGYRENPKGHRRERLAGFFAGGSAGSSSQASLNHGRRLGLRQIEMRGLVPLGEAEDGGYYF